MLIMSVGNSLNHIRNMAFIKFASGIIFMVCLVFSQSSSSKNKATRINEASMLETLLALVSQGNVVDGKSFQFRRGFYLTVLLYWHYYYYSLMYIRLFM